MAYEEVGWSNYRKNADTVEFTVRDPTKKKIDVLRASNNKDFRTCLGILKKYGFHTNNGNKKQKTEEKKNFKKEPDFLDPDFKWLKQGN